MKTLFLLTAMLGCTCAFQPCRAVSDDDHPKADSTAADSEFGWYDIQRPLGKTLVDLAKPDSHVPEILGNYARVEEFNPQLVKSKLYKVEADNKTYGLAILFGVPRGIPGGTEQYVLLTTPNGQILDTIRCKINYRYGDVRTEVLSKRDADGVWFVIRFEGRTFPGEKQNLWHNWHTIIHDDKQRTFRTPENKEPNEWNKKGLCRVGIENDKFAVIFPKLEKPDGDDRSD